MLTPQHRLLLAVASFVLGAYLLVSNDYVGILCLVASAYFGHSYFRYGTVWLAYREVAHGRMDAAVKLLGKVKAPEALGSEQRAYYELAWGLVRAARAGAENERAEQHLQSALSHQLRTDNDRALAEALLAQLLVARDDLDQARQLVDKALTRQCGPTILARLKSMKEELQSS